MTSSHTIKQITVSPSVILLTLAVSIIAALTVLFAGFEQTERELTAVRINAVTQVFIASQGRADIEQFNNSLPRQPLVADGTAVNGR